MISNPPGTTRSVRMIKRRPKPARTAAIASEIGLGLTGAA